MNEPHAAIQAPSHVDPGLVVDFDVYTDRRLFDDPHLTYRGLQSQVPDICYTPRNGGHWIVTRFDLMTQVLRDTEHFSNRELDIPKSNSPHVMIPLNLDPPDHTRYRAVLMRHFDKKTVTAMEPTLRAWAGRLIDRVAAAGTCDFSEALGAAFPVSVFMEMMGLPLERFEEFRTLVLEYFGITTVERRIQIQDTIFGHIRDLIADRRQSPRDDLMSNLIAEEVRGRPLSQEELESIGFLLFIAGLDTVANGLTFAFRHLAGDPALQARLAADPARIPDFVEESLRRYAVVNQTRIVKKDIDIDGARFRVGDMVLCPLTMGGMDDRKNPQPEQFDIDRQKREHITFSTGPHICIGNILARAEMRVFTEEWLKRIPSCAIVSGTKLAWRPGLVMALSHLPLDWSVPGKAA
ncbi:cytochrome P450 [Niveispirillum sp.]|uniref:cytochrome P450 n=1 Tax=Niveispirillum sp. TaxID=1917217 RepID=UPI001B75E4AC|nr:cytochrome P450 [Niveispirillum sp.]MBP7337393.1 cytochrome P450 [Niveispirillum sp.]